MSRGGPTEANFVNPIPKFSWMTPDNSSVVFDSEYALTPEAPVGPFPKTYVFDGKSVRLASVLPDGTPSGGMTTRQVLGIGGFEGSQGAISADGNRVFFSIPNVNNHSAIAEGLYVRDLATETTTEIHPPNSRVEFVAASTAGSKVLYEPEVPASGYSLYDTGTHSTKALTDDVTGSGTPEPTPTTLAVSADLDSIYFLSRGGELVAGHNPGGLPAIYRWQPGQEKLSYVATVKSAQTILQGFGAIYDTLPTRRDTAQTPSGSSFVFTTDSELETAHGSVYHNLTSSSACRTSVTAGNYEGRCPEVYLYEGATEEVSCLSCPNGAAKAPALLAGLSSVAQTSTLNQRSIGKARSISADGSRVFFESGEQLVPADTNDRTDVYMWQRAQGLKLLTSGTSQYDARILEASADGKDVFIVTRQRLVRGDTDNLADLYDVRVDGGFSEPGVLAPLCTGEDCHGEPTAAPSAVAPASSSFSGPGNPNQHKKKAHKKKAHKKKAHKKAHETKKHGKKKSAKKKSRHADANRGTGR